jgi:hypothetical protein
MNLKKAILGGCAGSGFSYVAMWVIFGLFKLEPVLGNIYIAVAIAGFFSAFFAFIFHGKSCNKS